MATAAEADISWIKERPEEQRFWVVRASGGQFVQHFRSAGVAAIGHLNELNLSEGPLDAGFAANVERRLALAYPNKSKGSITSHANQVKVLVAEMKNDDLVVTLDSSHLMIGVVSGVAHISDKPVVVQGLYREWEMEHRLRRSVKWGPLLSRSAIPAALEMTLFAHQTVFNIDEHWASIYHLLYPCFKYGNRLYLSANIEQPREIDNYAVAQFFSLLSGVEAAGAALSQGAVDISYGQMVDLFRRENSYSLTTRAEFMSPGTAWSVATMGTKRMAWTALIYVMLFGGDMQVIKTDGVITKEMREKAWSVVVEMAQKHDLPKVKEYLRLDIPHVDTRALDDHDEHVA